mmetsp:Transcript_6983/g.28147  ORF Transcript_6983/g.28147 Transcript_6983/m.28147 type:complete len:229 (+) Transcript_6983:8136-8822(+)
MIVLRALARVVRDGGVKQNAKVFIRRPRRRTHDEPRLILRHILVRAPQKPIERVLTPRDGRSLQRRARGFASPKFQRRRRLARRLSKSLRRAVFHDARALNLPFFLQKVSHRLRHAHVRVSPHLSLRPFVPFQHSRRRARVAALHPEQRVREIMPVHHQPRPSRATHDSAHQKRRHARRVLYQHLFAPLHRHQDPKQVRALRRDARPERERERDARGGRRRRRREGGE